MDCSKCRDWGCARCGGVGCEASVLPVSPWTSKDGVREEDQGPWCECCITEFVTAVLNTPHRRQVEALRFLRTLAEHADSWVIETPDDRPSSLHDKTTSYDKGGRTKYLNRVSTETFQFSYPHKPLAFDQVNFTSPYPYFMNSEIARVVLDLVPARDYPATICRTVRFPGAVRMGVPDLRHVRRATT